MSKENEFGQLLGDPLPDWQTRCLPQPVTLNGYTCRIEPLNVEKHADDLFAAYSLVDGRLWTYTFQKPFTSIYEFRRFIELTTANGEGIGFAIIDLKTNKAVGQFVLRHADPKNGVVELGGTVASPLLMQSILSTESQYLIMAYVFDQLGYRRYYSKCNIYNVPSLKALQRFGFTMEGVLRNYGIVKGRSVDFAILSVIDADWPQIKASVHAWLAPENFDQQKRQIRKLEDIREAIKRRIQGVSSSL